MLLLLLEVGGLEDLIHVDLVARDEEVADPEEVGHGGDHRETVHVAAQILLQLHKDQLRFQIYTEKKNHP